MSMTESGSILAVPSSTVLLRDDKTMFLRKQSTTTESYFDEEEVNTDNVDDGEWEYPRGSFFDGSSSRRQNDVLRDARLQRLAWLLTGSFATSEIYGVTDNVNGAAAWFINSSSITLTSSFY
ncbi:hypothetical protein F2Q69_00054291 [Brassica cretica]|uniref:Uncharacterized protein n=1 Tax=Brassica cretica TaxID=69181 RepID=A0A8S9N020_BRACR|nr:hypothetical protein F2Q69_00054291 [Brassica cretica]